LKNAPHGDKYKKDKKMNSDIKDTGRINLKLRSLLPLMFTALVVLIVFATAVGAVSVPFFQTVKIILKNWGLLPNAVFSQGQESIIYFVRLPRVILAALVGAGLGTSGAVMQGMFRNPMADPGVLGVSSGASLGAVIAIALGLAAKSIYFMPMFASAGALSASFVIFLLASRKGKIPAVNLILSGIAVSMFLSAITTIILTFIHGEQVKQFLFWTVGSLNGRRWEDIRIAVLPISICILMLFFFARDMNVLLLGEEEAQSVGMNTSHIRKILLLFSSISTAAAVCVSGTISFVGLIVPHIMRMILGPDHRILLPASAIGGAIFLVACDLIGRVVAAPVEIGVGIVTSLLGAPYFLILLNRAGKEGGIF
jgi:iron complex transport system permease protein